MCKSYFAWYVHTFLLQRGDDEYVRLSQDERRSGADCDSDERTQRGCLTAVFCLFRVVYNQHLERSIFFFFFFYLLERDDLKGAACNGTVFEVLRPVLHTICATRELESSTAVIGKLLDLCEKAPRNLLVVPGMYVGMYVYVCMCFVYTIVRHTKHSRFLSANRRVSCEIACEIFFRVWVLPRVCPEQQLPLLPCVLLLVSLTPTSVRIRRFQKSSTLYENSLLRLVQLRIVTDF